MFTAKYKRLESVRLITDIIAAMLCGCLVQALAKHSRFGRSSACGHRALQTLCQSPRQRGHAQIPTGGADAVRAQQFFQEIPAVTRHSRRRFDPPPTAGGVADHRPSVGPGTRWRHRGAIQDALGGTLRTFVGAGNGTPPLSPPYLALLGRTPGPAPPNQPPLPPNADRGGAARTLPQQRGTFPRAGLRSCSPRRLALSLPRHGASKGSPLWVQGRRWAMVAWKNRREHNRGQGIPGPLSGRPGTDQTSWIKLPLPSARYTTSTGAVRVF